MGQKFTARTLHVESTTSGGSGRFSQADHLFGNDEEILNAVWAKIAAETRANPDKYKEHDERVRQWSAQRKAAADAPPESSED